MEAMAEKRKEAYSTRKEEVIVYKDGKVTGNDRKKSIVFCVAVYGTVDSGIERDGGSQGAGQGKQED